MTADKNNFAYDCTGVLLAGGKNNRLPGRKKGFRTVGESRILDQTFDLFSRVFKEVILVVNDPKAFCGYDAVVVTDMVPAGCALAGLYTGLFHARTQWIYASACDIPFASEAVIRHLLANRKPGKEIVIPRSREGLEPLSALYHKSCLPLMQANLEQHRYMIKKSFRPRKVWEIPPEDLEQLDPNMRFKFNVNTPEDLARARAMANEATVK
jgi:molybdopterin-guanine dinucleotide biosynthesis protein A